MRSVLTVLCVSKNTEVEMQLGGKRPEVGNGGVVHRQSDRIYPKSGADGLEVHPIG